MQAATREILTETMTRDWLMVWAGVPGLRPDGYHVIGTAAVALTDFQLRFPFIPIRASKIVQDDGDWTIRITFADGSIATVFAS